MKSRKQGGNVRTGTKLIPLLKLIMIRSKTKIKNLRNLIIKMPPSTLKKTFSTTLLTLAIKDHMQELIKRRTLGSTSPNGFNFSEWRWQPKRFKGCSELS